MKRLVFISIGASLCWLQTHKWIFLCPFVPIFSVWWILEIRLKLSRELYEIYNLSINEKKQPGFKGPEIRIKI